MVWAKLDDRFNDHPVLLGVPRGARLLYVEGLVWCCKQETDGVIPAGAVPRFTDEPELPAAIEQLVAAGLWEITPTGWQMVGFLEQQRAKADIDRDRADAAERQKRSRQHSAGDHSLCTKGRYCPAGELEPSQGQSRGLSQRDSLVKSRPPDLTRPDPSEGKGKGEGSAHTLTSAPPTSGLPRPRVVAG